MHEKTKALIDLGGLLARYGGVPLEAELSHGIRNGVVKASVQGTKLVDAERRIALHRQVGNRLAKVPVVVNDLVDRKAQLQELLAVRRGA